MAVLIDLECAEAANHTRCSRYRDARMHQFGHLSITVVQPGASSRFLSLSLSGHLVHRQCTLVAASFRSIENMAVSIDLACAEAENHTRCSRYRATHMHQSGHSVGPEVCVCCYTKSVRNLGDKPCRAISALVRIPSLHALVGQ